MNTIVASVLLVFLPAGEGKQAPKIPVGKETTYLTGPLDREGYVDYRAALNDRLGKGITPEKNAVVLLWKALGPTPAGSQEMPAEYFKRLGIPATPKKGDYFISLDFYLRDRLNLGKDQIDAVLRQLDWAGKRPWAARDCPHLAAWLKANEKPLALVREAASRPDYFNPLVVWPVENKPPALLDVRQGGVRECRELTSALAARALLRVGQGQADEAWQDLLACHRLARLIGRGGTLIEGLVSIALERGARDAELAYLERAKLTPGQIQERLKDLLALSPTPPMADRIDTWERFTFLDTVQLLRRGGLALLEGGGPDGPRKVKRPTAEELMALELIDWESALRVGNRWYDRLTTALRLRDRAAREKELARTEEDLDALVKKGGAANLAKIFQGKDLNEEVGKAIGNHLLGVLVSAFRKVQAIHERSEQEQRNLHVAFALAAHHRDHGHYPPQLADLAPKYLAAVPTDLFSGKALIYRPTEKGYLLYSVGANGRDEGGRSVDDDPKADDLPVRMPLPALKRPN
jgi:hypothetical protein